MILDPLYAFVFAGLFSPGPNVVMLIASGARFGFQPTLPHILGVAAGVGITAGLTGLGLAEVLNRLPGIRLVLQVIAAGWIFYLAWRLFRSSRMAEADPDARPFTFLQAVLFQWVNPKVWAIALAAATLFPGDGVPLSQGARLAVAFAGINLGVCLFWTFAGHSLTRFLTRPALWRGFMTVMAGALAASGLLVFL
ncbi:LysE family translocator [Oceanibium sediminis]|uniref:LysE family translocator n=1 Tax=Oceanibium sediminis TaxID=2026339 RepID=UPI000DD33E29|nr:LysE family translocator [Oceanibium sediminis]